jgi:hypothetical protein
MKTRGSLLEKPQDMKATSMLRLVQAPKTTQDVRSKASAHGPRPPRALERYLHLAISVAGGCQFKVGYLRPTSSVAQGAVKCERCQTVHHHASQVTSKSTVFLLPAQHSFSAFTPASYSPLRLCLLCRHLSFNRRRYLLWVVQVHCCEARADPWPSTSESQLGQCRATPGPGQLVASTCSLSTRPQDITPFSSRAPLPILQSRTMP